MDKKKILIIDDDEDLCLLYKKHIEAMSDFEVNTASDGEDGLALARDSGPSIIILDILMPGMSGLEVLEKLKEDSQTAEIPVIMLSGKDDDALKLKATHLCDDVYLTKPVEAKELKNKIEDILRIRETYK